MEEMKQHVIEQNESFIKVGMGPSVYVTQCLVCDEEVVSSIEKRSKICEKCKSAIMKVRTEND